MLSNSLGTFWGQSGVSLGTYREVFLDMKYLLFSFYLAVLCLLFIPCFFEARKAPGKGRSGEGAGRGAPFGLAGLCWRWAAQWCMRVDSAGNAREKHFPGAPYRLRFLV